MYLSLARLREIHVECGSNPHVEQYLRHVEERTTQDVKAAIHCLEHHGYAVIAPKGHEHPANPGYA